MNTSGCEYELALAAFGKHLAGLGIDDLGVEVVLIDVHSGLLPALESDTGAGGLCEAVDVISFDSEALLDALAHFLGPGLCPENAGFEFVVLRFVAALCKGLTEICRIGRSAAQDRRIQVKHELDLAISVAGR